MLKSVGAFAIAAFVPAAYAASITYEIYDFTGDPKGALVAKGVRAYGPQELRVEKIEGRGEIHWQKSLELQEGYRIAASIHRQPKVTGFGLWAESRYCGFSWEWFKAASANRFDKLQEGGAVSVEYRAVGALQELASITFESDISLRIDEEDDADAVTQRVLIKKGSVFAFGPEGSGEAPPRRACESRSTPGESSVVVGPFHSREAVTRWFMFYYRTPDPDHLAEAIEYMSLAGMLDKKHAMAPTAGFLAGVFRDHPGRVAEWIERLRPLKEEHLAAVVLGLWYADLPESRARAHALLDAHPGLNRQMAFLRTGAPVPIAKVPLEQGPGVLDALWGNFMATGRREPVERIMGALPWLDTKDHMGRFLTASAARWSLTSNAVQHDRVLEICQAALKSQPAEVTLKLKPIVDEAVKERKSEEGADR